MDILLFMIPLALLLGLLALYGFVWSLKNRQFEDLEGDGHRILEDDSHIIAKTRKDNAG